MLSQKLYFRHQMFVGTFILSRIRVSVMEYYKNETQFRNFSSSKNERPANGTLAGGELSVRTISIISLYSVISLVGVLGNGFVCQMIIRSRRKSHFKILLCSLALADLLSSILFPILFIQDLLAPVLGNKWYLGSLLCQLLPATTPMLLTASTWSLVVISIERYRAVRWPVAGRDKKRITFVVLLVVWSSAAALSAPLALTWRIHGDLCVEVTDYLDDKETFVYLIVATVIIWVVPCIILAIIYTSIARELKNSELQHANNRAVVKKIKQNRHLVRMFILLVALFSLLSFPYAVFFCVIRYIKTFRHDLLNAKRIQELILWNTLLFVSCLINSAINPIIYAKIYSGKGRAIRICCLGLRSRFRTMRSIARDYSMDAIPTGTKTNTMQTHGEYRAQSDQQQSDNILFDSAFELRTTSL